MICSVTRTVLRQLVKRIREAEKSHHDSFFQLQDPVDYIYILYLYLYNICIYIKYIKE